MKRRGIKRRWCEVEFSNHRLGLELKEPQNGWMWSRDNSVGKTIYFRVLERYTWKGGIYRDLRDSRRLRI
jgi:hypothetical protein